MIMGFLDSLNSVLQKNQNVLLFLSDSSPLSNKEKSLRQACLSCSSLFFPLFIPSRSHWRCFFSLSEKPGERCKLHQGQTSCLGAGGTLATRLNSNYACMGLPPDDMIGILTQTHIQNRIREEPNKRHLIERSSCVISFSMPSLSLHKWAAPFLYSKSLQSFCAGLFFFLSATFPWLKLTLCRMRRRG